MARIKLSGQRGPKRSGQRGCKKTEVGRGYVVLVGLSGDQAAQLESR